MTTRRWLKRGLIVALSRSPASWMTSHAQVPTALVLADRIRVYFATRPAPGVTLPAYVDLEIDDPACIIEFGRTPLMELGSPGSFDEHGIMPSSVLAKDGRVFLYYSGWSRLAGRAPYHNTTGLAVSDDGGLTFQRFAEGPILDRAAREPFSATSPCVVEAGSGWRAFYSSGIGWLDIDGKMEHVYDIKSATSQDGVAWQRDGVSVIPQLLPENALTRPSVLSFGSEWGMWFCHRGSRGFRGAGDSYRIGFARSYDLTTWERDDAAAGIDISADGWDSEMMAYPCVVRAGHRILMFYNGNGFGRDGFGLAILEA